MYKYLCCRCIKCEAQIVLEDTNLLHRPPTPRPEHETCIVEQNSCQRATT